MLEQLLPHNPWADIPETGFIASGTLAHHSLLMMTKGDLDLFYGKVNFGNWLSYGKKVKTLNFQNYCSLRPETYEINKGV